MKQKLSKTAVCWLIAGALFLIAGLISKHTPFFGVSAASFVLSTTIDKPEKR